MLRSALLRLLQPPRSLRSLAAPAAAVALLSASLVAPAASASAAVQTVVAPPGMSRFVPLAPARVLDTRSGVGAAKARPAAGATVPLQVTGHGGVPASGVTAVTLNVVVTNPRQLGYVQALPSDSGTLGTSSNLNVYYQGQTSGNLVTVPVGADGAVRLYDVAGGDLVADVLGYFAATTSSADGRYVGLTPTRILDTRDSTAPAPGTALKLAVAGAGGVPASGVSAVAMTVTATQSRAAGFVQVVPTGGPTALGTTSNVNLTGAGQTVANLVMVPIGSDGSVQLYNSSGTHLIVDVVGYFTDTHATASGVGLFVPVTPARLLDTRQSGRAQADSLTTLAALGDAGIPTDRVSALFLNPTATDPVAAGYLQLFPSGQGALGKSSSLNFTGPGQTITTASVGTVGDQGDVDIYTPTATHVIVDVFGYFTGTAAGPVRYTAWSWGWNGEGELGDGTGTSGPEQLQIGSDTRWVSVSAGESHTVGIRSDGTLWTWGLNADGQLGDGTTTDRWAPVRVGTSNDWAFAEAGVGHTVAVKTDGTLWAWGANTYGQLGDGTTTSRTVPEQIGTDTSWARAAAGWAHTVAVKTDGTLWTWGNNISGALGDGTDTSRTTPAQVGAGTTWSQVSAGYDLTVATKTDGTLWTWGDNTFGQLGVGSAVASVPTPGQVGTGGWASMSAGGGHVVAIKTNGTLWAWGFNDDGELGDGTTAGRSAPVQVGTSTGWTSVSAGNDHTVGLRSDGSMWAWGYNGAGALGDGTTTDRLSPVLAGTGWAAVSAGYAFTIALKS